MFGFEITRQFRAETPAPDSDFWYGRVDGVSATGYPVTPDSAMRAAAVFACVRCTSETVATLLPIVYRRLPGGGKERATDNPLYKLLHDKPNEWQTAFEFWEMLQAHLELRGNGYAQIAALPDGTIDQLLPLHPDRVMVKRLETGRLVYSVRRLDGTSQTLNQEDMFHLRGMSSDGLIGMGPIQYEREAVGVSLAAQDYAARFFKNDARPGMVLEVPQKLSEEATKRLRNSVQEAQTGANRHKTMVLEQGMKATQIGLTNRDSQFIEAREFQIEDIARIFRVPPHKIGHLKRATFSNIEHQSIEWVQDSMLPRLKRIEQAIWRDLIQQADGSDEYFVEFNVDALQRGDIASRYDAYSKARNWGWLSVNEIREKENLNPIEEGDEYLQPLNMVPAGTDVVPPATGGTAPPQDDNAAQDDKQEAATKERLLMLAQSAAARVVRKEVTAFRKENAKDPANFMAFADRFYPAHQKLMVEALHINPAQAGSYVCDRIGELGHVEASSREELFSRWESTCPGELAAMAMEGIQ